MLRCTMSFAGRQIVDGVMVSAYTQAFCARHNPKILVLVAEIDKEHGNAGAKGH